jgi:hypothetical protein
VHVGVEEGRLFVWREHEDSRSVQESGEHSLVFLSTRTMREARSLLGDPR